jgi:mannose-6-phosphate isomerase-like protein (cupin superfamily)
VRRRLLHVAGSEGRPKLGGRVILKIGADAAAGAFTLCYGRTPPGVGPPLHMHEQEDETFYVLRGTYQLQCGPARVTAGIGSCVHLPRYTPHTFRNVGDEPAELVEFMTPGGIERYFDAVEHLGPIATDLEARSKIGRPYGISFPTDPGAYIDAPAGEERRPIVVTVRGEGRRLELAGNQATCKVESVAAGGLHNLVEVEQPAGGELPLSRPGLSLVVVIEGRLTVKSDGECVLAKPADSVAVFSPEGLNLAADGGPARFLLYSVGPAT